MKSVIPAGYRVSISSWENDGDNNQKKVIEGLAKRERIKYLADVCKLFKSKSLSTETEKFYGNMYEPDRADIEEACSAIVVVMAAHRDALDQEEQDLLDAFDMDCIGDYITDFLGELLGYSEDYWVRVFAGMKVEYTPVEITLDDVTGEFL